jgi:hypothetical protein
MAFCNGCGAVLGPGTKFCNKCGATVTGGAAPAAPAPTGSVPSTSAPAGGGSALKIILIVVAAIVVVGILCVAMIGFIGYRVARSARVTHDGDHVKVETPFGSVDATKDPEQASRDLGVEIYPGAQVQKSGATSATFGGIHTVAANFESSDPMEKVCSFYKAKYPAAVATTANQNRCSIVSNDRQNMISINIQPNGDGTKFQITNVSKNSFSSK